MRSAFLLLAITVALADGALAQRRPPRPPPGDSGGVQPMCKVGCVPPGPNGQVDSHTFVPGSRPPETGPLAYVVNVRNIGTEPGDMRLECTIGVGDPGQMPCSVVPFSQVIGVNQVAAFTVTYSTRGLGTFRHRWKIFPDDIATPSYNALQQPITVVGQPLQTHLVPIVGQQINQADTLRAVFQHTSGITTASLRVYIDGVDKTSQATVSGSTISLTNLALATGNRVFKSYGCAASGRCDSVSTQFLWVGPPPSSPVFDSVPPPENEVLSGLLPGALPLPPANYRGCPVTTNAPEIRLTSPFTYTSQPAYGSTPYGFIFMAQVNWEGTVTISSVTVDHAAGDPTTCNSYVWLEESQYNWNFWMHTDPNDPLWTSYPYGDRVGGGPSGLVAWDPNAPAAPAAARGARAPGANPFTNLFQHPAFMPRATTARATVTRPAGRLAELVRRRMRRPGGGGDSTVSGDGPIVNIVDPGAINPNSYNVWLNGTQIVINGQPASGVTKVSLAALGSTYTLPNTHAAVNNYVATNPAANNGGWNEVIAQISDSSGNTSSIRARFAQVGSESGTLANLHPTPLRDFTHVDQGDCAAFGAFQCDGLVLTQTIPGFVSRDRDRSLHLIYRSNSQQVPLALPVRIEVDRLDTAPDSMEVYLTENGARVGDSVVYQGTKASPGTPAGDFLLRENANEVRIVGAELGAPGPWDYFRRIRVNVRGYYPGGAVREDTASQDVVQHYLTLDSRTRIGFGWTLAEVGRLFIQTPAGQAPVAVWIRGDGSHVAFRKVNGVWQSPAGETARLVDEYTAGSSWVIHFTDGSSVGFRGVDGHQVWTADLLGNRTIFEYTGYDGPVLRINDPSGVYYEFGYLNGWLQDVWQVQPATGQSQLLATLARDGAARLTTVTLWRAPGVGETTRYTYKNSAPGAFVDSIIDPRSTPSAPIVTTVNYDPRFWTPTHITRPPDRFGAATAQWRDVMRRSVAREGRGRLGNPYAERTLAPNQWRGTFLPFAGRATDYQVDRFGGPTYVRTFAPPGFMTSDFLVVTYGGDDTRHIERDATGRVTKIVAARDSALSGTSSVADSVMYEYDASNNLVRIIQPTRQHPAPQGQMDTVSFTYDTHWSGNQSCTRMLSTRDAMGGVTTFTHGIGGGIVPCVVIGVNGFAGDTTWFAYNSLTAGVPSATRPWYTFNNVGQYTYFYYNATTSTENPTWNTRVAQRGGDNAAVRRTFTSFGRPDSTADPLGVATVTRSDGLSRVVRQKTGTGLTTPVTANFYGPSGLLDSVRVYAAYDVDAAPSGAVQTTRYYYDRLGRLDSTRTPGGRVTSYLRDGYGNPYFECVGNGSWVGRLYDWAGRMSAQVLSPVDPRQLNCGQQWADATTRTVYGNFGMIGNTTLHFGSRHQYGYDNRGRLVSQLDSVLTTKRVYNGAGQLVLDSLAFTDGARVVRRYEYNRRGQRTMVADTVRRTADNAIVGTGRTDYAWGASARLDRVTAWRDGAQYATVDYRYDAAGRDTLHWVDLAGAVTSLTTRTQFDAQGRVGLRETFNYYGTWHSFRATGVHGWYDLADRLRAATAIEPNPSGGGPSLNWNPTFGYTYEANGSGRIETSSRTHINGTNYSWTYDVFGNRLTEYCSSPYSTCTNVDALTYGSDNRLERRVDSGPSNRINRFWTDAMGNRLMRVDSTTGGGNLGPQEMLSYTARGQLYFSMTPTASPSNYNYNWHWYDGSGLRVVTHVTTGSSWIPSTAPTSGTRTYYVYDGADVAMTLVGTTAAWRIQQRFLSAGVDQPIGGWFNTNGGGAAQNLAFVTDHQGSVRAAIRADGNRENDAVYFARGAFGNLEAPTTSGEGGTQTNTQTGYTGASTPNAGGGFTYLRNRWYDPATGRFLTQDPIGLAGGVNLYAYAGSDPVSFSDPFGLKPCPPHCSFFGTDMRSLPRPGPQGFAGMHQTAGAGWYGGMERAAAAIESRLYAGVSVTHVQPTSTLSTSASGRTTLGNSFVVGMPNVGASFDLGLNVNRPRPNSVAGSLDFGMGRHSGISVNVAVDDQGLQLTGLTLHLGISSPTPPVQGSLAQPGGLSKYAPADFGCAKGGICPVR